MDEAAVAVRCTECARSWEDAGERWRVYLTDDDPPMTAAYCPTCARREFDCFEEDRGSDFSR